MEAGDISGTNKRKRGGSKEEEEEEQKAKAEEEETLNLNQAATNEKKKRYFPSKDRPFRLLPREDRYDPIESRVSKLKKMIGILKKMEKSLRSPERDASPPTLAELRLYNLIFRHADTVIFLYHREAADAKVLLSSDTTEDGVDVDLDMLKSQVRMATEDIDEIYNYGSWNALSEFLSELENWLEKNSSANKDGIDIEEEEDMEEEEDSPEQRIREQNLLDILFGLEAMGNEQGFRPPEDDKEILCYKKIRECVTSSLLYVEAKAAVSFLRPYTTTPGN